MKKFLLVFLAMMLVVGIVGIVMATSAPQGVSVPVTGTSSMTISPGTVTFPSVTPGTPRPLDDAITFTADVGSNEDFSISVLSVTDIFSGNIDVSIADAASFGALESFSANMDCITDGVTPCTYNAITLDAILDVPSGTPAGSHSGVITYLITATPVFT
ncbi:MAG: hypothetical protein KKA64_00635 [Nanoarchaeota archaeon]|nr:hypothetical protein [Nanoarchaeota archaeon]